MRQANYDKFPATKMNGKVFVGWQSILHEIIERYGDNGLIAIELYIGTHEEEIMNAFSAQYDIVINTRALFISEERTRELTDAILTDDVLFGHKTHLSIIDFFDEDKVAQAKQLIHQVERSKRIAVIGVGASTIVPEDTPLLYADMARREITLRYRRNEIMALGIDNREEPISIQYKRGYFNDWPILDKHKETLLGRVSYWIDTHIAHEPKMMNAAVFRAAIEKTVSRPFRVVPFFDPAPWGGQWMKEVCQLDRAEPNYGWCFDCVPEENSLYFDVSGTIFEIPAIDLVLMKSHELLGESVEARFGKDFPIRFDFLDTMEGGNLSLQVHPTNKFIQDNFGMTYTQDESYYLLDAEEGAHVYLGLKKGISPCEMLRDLRSAQNGEIVFEAEKYVNKIPAKKHDHFLIPGGTIHCSGAGSMVLEISSTPNIFTFKLWDWQRLGLDGKPRPINIDRGEQVINWSRDEDMVKQQLHNIVKVVARGDGWMEEKTGLHPLEFIETRRHTFTKEVHHSTEGGVNVLNLIEGEEAVIESPTGIFEPFVVHYAETFIVPAAVGQYTVRPYGKSEGKECKTIKAYIRN